MAVIPVLLGSSGLVLLMIGYLWLLEEAFAVRTAWGVGVLCVPLLAGPLLVVGNHRARTPCAVFFMGFGSTAVAVVAGHLVRAAEF